MFFTWMRCFFRMNSPVGKPNRRRPTFQPCVQQLEDRLAPASYSILQTFAFSNGSQPRAGLIADAAGDLFGTTEFGGANLGTVFELVKSGNSYTPQTLHSFAGGADGGYPLGSLIADAAGDLLGTTDIGGANNNGTVFELVKSGSSYTVSILYSFGSNFADGLNPRAGLLADSSGDLFSTTGDGGLGSYGIVFELTSPGVPYTEKILHAFPAILNDGLTPESGLIADANGDLFGTTELGGASNAGMVFELVNNGSSYTYTIVHSFAGPDGSGLQASLIADGSGDLFGTAEFGGASNLGTVFELVKSGSSYNISVLHSFAGGAADGGKPIAPLIADSNGNLFGTTNSGGASNLGTVFELVKSGSSYNVSLLHSFSGGSSDGANSAAGLLADSSGDLFGTTASGGANNDGVVFELTRVHQRTVGVLDPNNAVFHLSNVLAKPGAGDIAFQYGGLGWEPFAGNFSGTGLSTPGVFDPNNAIFHISKVLGNPGAGDIAFQYGGLGWDPLAGNFFGTSTDTVGVFDPNNAVFHLSNLLGNPGSKDYAFQYGGAGWVPLAGNFFGTETVGVYDPNNAVFHLSNVLNNPGAADYAFQYGGRGWVPVVGDFFGLGHDTVGVFDPNNGVFHLSNVLGNPGAADYAFQYGGNGWVPIAGDWDFPTFPQLAAGGEAQVASGAAPLTEDQLQTEVQVALNLLASDGVNAALLNRLGSLQFTVGQLPAGYLGLSEVATGAVEISADAASYGWFVDPNPLQDSVPANRMDLLTVVLHEMGHFDGWTELDPTSNPDALMALTLGTGLRRIQDIDTVFAAGL